MPSGGDLIYRGQNLSAAGEAELTQYRRHHVGFVFQFYNLIPSLTARASLGGLERGVGEEQMPVSSPIDGRVLEKLRTSEGVVQAGTPLLAVGDPPPGSKSWSTC